ncbi:MAG: hypothetical protein ABSB01_02015 [Streptosporangiaceae bacterium]
MRASGGLVGEPASRYLRTEQCRPQVGIVGAAAAIANAVYHATGIRVPDLPIRLDKLLR